jgi:glyoxylase-like metal-dependent hydrolase (beta-lactamase superfamily II)
MVSAYSYKIGDLTITAATDGIATRPLDAGFVTNADFADVQAALEDAFMPTEALDIPFTPVVARAGSDLVLFDTGFADNGPPSAGFLRANMAAAGIQPEDITKVVITHFHPDHIHGLKTKAGELVYPNAEVMVPATEWAFWTNDANRANVAEGRQGLFDLVAAKFGGIEVTEYAWDQEIVTGITAIDASGHTPGHTAFAFVSGDDRMLLLADTTNHPALFVANPDWSAVFDQDADQARATRHRLLDMAASERMHVTGYHFPFPAAGHIARDGDGYRLVPTNWKPI